MKSASLSLDLDNLWSYLKTHGDPGWQTFPSYFDIVVPRFLELLEDASLKITVFVVGQDAALDASRPALKSIADAGHEIANHSFHHEPWLHLYTPNEVAEELARAESAIFQATGHKPVGFRGPGYSVSETVLRVLERRGYEYDCSTFPTVVGPLARAYYFAKSQLNADQKEKRKALFGGISDGIRPNAPYRWDLGDAQLTEVPVTTLPYLRVPFHFSYLHWIAGASDSVASGYFASSLRTCDVAQVAPSLLLHPLDFLGGDDVKELSFFPAMNQTSAEKMKRMREYLTHLTNRYEVETMRSHAARLESASLRLRRPDFGKDQSQPSKIVHEDAT
jgi:peptidoglycan/xylan/chitin deacetylase (PgdA/CDA1 family)